jgi:hypothetical protein
MKKPTAIMAGRVNQTRAMRMMAKSSLGVAPA